MHEFGLAVTVSVAAVASVVMATLLAWRADPPDATATDDPAEIRALATA